MSEELTGAVPKDDAPAPIDAEAADTTETTETAEAGDDIDAAALAAVAEDDEGGKHGIPKSRFDEVNNDRKELRDQNARLMALLEAGQQRAPQAEAAPAAETEQPRDFEGEFSALQAKYNSGELDDDEFRKAERKLIREEAKYDAMQEVKPLVQELANERNRVETERVTSALNAEAAKAYEKYPFLDHNGSVKNPEAIAAVLKERDELIRTGVAPVKALRLAVASIAPDYGDAAPPKTADELAAARKLKARVDAGNAETAQPPNLGGAGSGGRTTGVQRLGASVKDNEKWAKLPEADRAKAFTA